MKTIKHITVFLILFVITACGKTQGNNESVRLTEREAYRYDKALQAIEKVEFMCEQVASSPSQETVISLLSKAKELKYEYNDDGMNVATIKHCDSLKMRIENCQQRAASVAEQMIISSKNINVPPGDSLRPWTQR